MTKARGAESGMQSKGSPAEAPSASPAPAPESLEDYPKAFADTDSYPWEQAPDVPRWPTLWDYDRGRPLTSFYSAELLRRREQLAQLIVAIDAVLSDRGGE